MYLGEGKETSPNDVIVGRSLGVWVGGWLWLDSCRGWLGAAVGSCLSKDGFMLYLGWLGLGLYPSDPSNI